MFRSAACKKLPDFPLLYKDFTSLASHHKLFSVWISPGIFGRSGKRICQNILEPLRSATREVLIYDLEETHRRARKFASYLDEKHGRHSLDISKRKWSFFLPLLLISTPFGIIHDLRGSVVLECDITRVDWKSIFTHCCGPIIVNNFRSGCGKSTINYVRRKETDERVFVILEQVNSGLESISIASTRKTIVKLFEMAAFSSSLSPGLEHQFEIMEKHEKKGVVS